MSNDGIVERCARWTESWRFQRATIVLILVNAVLVGLETDRAVAAAYEVELAWAFRTILVMFTLELGLRVVAHGRGWRRFFHSGWNLFDVAVVVLSLVPDVGAWATIGRLARVLRIGRLVSVSPQPRLIVATMLRSVPSLGHVGLLLGLLLYIYAVMGVELFADADPAHWATLGRALLSLFQILTLEGWVELQRASMVVHPWAWVFYASFALIAVFVVVNLFIAVVLSNLELARRELEPASKEPTIADVLARVDALRFAAGDPPAPQFDFFDRARRDFCIAPRHP